jgi:putative oxidoreductase
MATYAEPIAERRVTPRRRAEPYAGDQRSLLAPAGRALFALIFIASGFMHFSPATIGYGSSQGVPLAGIVVPLSGIIAIAGGLSVLLGFHARIGAWLLVLFLVPVTFTMHQFWNVADPAARAIQLGMFMKNLAMLGGALLVAYFGAGAISLDEWRNRRSA